MPFYNWSTTPASNAASDSTCPFPEGMSPSAVNDGVRALMARMREYGNDVAGSIVTTGTSTAYAVLSNQGFTSLSVLGGQPIAFTPHTTCGATVTLNVDLLGTKPLRLAPGVELQAGTIVQGTPYLAVYNATDGAFYLRGYMPSPYNIPIGGMMPYLSTTAPNSNFVLPYGQAISRTVYATIFAMVGTTFGTGDGSTTFNIPDLRGRFLAGLDTMGGVASGRLTSAAGGVDGTTIGASGGAQANTLLTSNLPPYTPSGSIVNGAILLNGSSTLNSIAQSTPNNNGPLPGAGGYGQNIGVSASQAASTFAGAAQGGTSAPFTNVPPSIVVPWILRVI